MPPSCRPLSFIKTDSANTDGREECFAMGDDWMHLRLELVLHRSGCA
jgi:hypothetical protein